MKRFTSIIAAFCLIIGTITGFRTEPVIKAAANEPEQPGKVTVVDFADYQFPEYETLAEVKVASGSAITFAGGRSQWNFGAFIIEPNPGWTLVSAECDSEQLTVEKLNEVISKIGSNMGNADKIPEIVKNKFGEYDTVASTTDAIYVGRDLYANKMRYRRIFFNFADERGNESQVTIQINSDYSVIDEEVTVGTVFNVFEFDDVKDTALNGYDKKDYTIRYSPQGSTRMDAVSAEYENENSVNYGEFKAEKSGVYEIALSNKKNGLDYNVVVDFLAAGNSPLKKDDFIIGPDADVYGDDDRCQYYVEPVGNEYFSELTIQFTLPDGVTVKDISYCNNSVFDLDELEFRYNEYPGATFRVEKSINNSVVNIGISSLTQNYALRNSVSVTLSKDGTDYDYTFGIGYKRPLSSGSAGNQIMPYAPSSIISVKQLFYFTDEDLKKFCTGINNGDYAFDARGLELLYENGEFKGNIVVYHPCSYVSIWNNTSSTQINGYDSQIQIRAKTAIEAGNPFDMSSLLNGYWNGDYADHCKVTGSQAYTLSGDGNRIFTAPESIDTVTTYEVSLSDCSDKEFARLIIMACPKGQLMNDLADIVKDVQADESLIVDVDEDASISGETLDNFMNNGGEGSSFVLKITTGKHKPEWHFNKNDLKEKAAGNIELNVKVGSELHNSLLDNLMNSNGLHGLKLGFAKNGKLPGKTGVRIYLSEEEVGQLGNKNKVQLYYYNEEGQLVLEAKNCYVVKDSNGEYYIEVTVTHNSDFLLTSAEEESYEAGTIESTVTFMNGESLISAKKAAEGTVIEKPADPVKAEDAGHTYTFKGWSTDKTNVVTVAEKYGKDDLTYYAVFEAKAKDTSSGSGNGSGTGTGSTTQPAVIIVPTTPYVPVPSTPTPTPSIPAPGKEETTPAPEKPSSTPEPATPTPEITENSDGTTTTSTEKKNKDGSVTITAVTTDSEGNVLATTKKKTSVNKRGTTVVSSTTTYADGSSISRTEKTTATGKVVTTTVEKDSDGKATSKITETVTTDQEGNATVEVKTANADGSTFNEKYNVSSKGSIKMISLDAGKKLITIPEAIEVSGKLLPVSTIGKNAMKGNKKLKRVSIGKNITVIGKEAFSGSKKLATIELTDSVKRISTKAFYGISKKAVFKITAATEDGYKRVVALIKASGVSSTVSFKWIRK